MPQWRPLSAPLPGTNLTGTIPDARLSTNVALLTNNVVFSGGVTATNFTGNGYGLSNVPATSLIGTIPDARLSANVPLLNTSESFNGTLAATQFVGNGYGLTNVPGAFFWITVTGNSVNAFPNCGYIATNNLVPLTVTLPPSPRVGDLYRVAGVGAAGWVVAQNANQTIFAGNLPDQRRATLEDERTIRQVVVGRVLRRRNQAGGGGERRLYLHFRQFRCNLDDTQFFTDFFGPLLVFRRIFRRRNQIGGSGGLHH